MHKTHVHPAIAGFNNYYSVPLLTLPGTPIHCRCDQARFYSSNIVKSVLKPTLKPVIVPPKGKRPPKGPRTKQPSRSNQPSKEEDEVMKLVVVCFSICCCLAQSFIQVLFCLQDMMQCIAFATADQYHLPTLSHDLINHGFQEIDLPRGMSQAAIISQLSSAGGLRNAAMSSSHCPVFISDASNVLVISTENAAKVDDDALIFFFR